MRWVLLVAGMVSAGLASAAQAQSAAQQQQACMGDAMKLCSSAIPDRGRVAACLSANRASLSPACRAMMDGGGDEKPRPARRG